jgi:hypothetical protein
MPMAAYRSVGDNERISAILAVGKALAIPNASLPSQSASQGDQHCLVWINNIRMVEALPRLPSLDYGGFTSALNVLVALVP